MNSVYELLIISAMALYLGDAFIEFFKDLNRDVIVPLLSPFSKNIKEAEDLTIVLFGIELKLGKVFVATVHLVFAIIMAIIVLRFLKKYASGWIRKLYK